METNAATESREAKLLKKLHFLSLLRTAACIVIMLVICYAVFTVLPQISATLTQFSDLGEQLNQLDLAAMTDSVTNMAEVGADSIVKASGELSATMEGLSAIDFEALAKSVDNLSAVSNALSRVFGR